MLLPMASALLAVHVPVLFSRSFTEDSIHTLAYQVQRWSSTQAKSVWPILPQQVTYEALQFLVWSMCGDGIFLSP